MGLEMKENEKKYEQKFVYKPLEDKVTFRVVPVKTGRNEYSKYLVMRTFDKDEMLVGKDGKIDTDLEPKNEIILKEIKDIQEFDKKFMNSTELNRLAEFYERISINISKILDDENLKEVNKLMEVSKQIAHIAKGNQVIDKGHDIFKDAEDTKFNDENYIKVENTLDGYAFDEFRDKSVKMPEKEYFQDGQKMIQYTDVLQTFVEIKKILYREELSDGDFEIKRYEERAIDSLRQKMQADVVPQEEWPPIITNIRPEDKSIEKTRKRY